MRPSLIRLASASIPKGLGNTPMALLPPIPLYRRLLRAHRKYLPTEMRLLGDEYIKAEFRAHRTVDNPAHLTASAHVREVPRTKIFRQANAPFQIGFLTEWQLYAQKVEGDQWKGDKIDPVKIAKMSDEQIGQLYELMQAIKDRSKQQGDGEES
ncbi:Succinate dehydrogenase assembly factor 3 [Colletotrichum gloeosporioides]|uniref:Succinate dehydrogenase assembly factor 3 n=1 Tax=Colletotrichum gloeosporioides TaxID=474922 RepID=A0A8H4FII8_COLGL|nr:Succinate dehydrogenase assembly factor 3 [Colletotrichum gloeosporioides]KAF3803360.1 Succinate dehydrogenase assembly factor 3 [Colletotrichum gloeosporioides]